MTFSFRPAVREQVGLLIALAGASGSGKTFSALRLAKGLADGKPIALIDTEARRALHYADQFQFLHADMAPPFRPERFLEAIRAAEKEGAAVIIIDSFSHEYDGTGGILEWADDLAEKGVKSPGNWKEPKMAHKRLVAQLLQARAHLIFCLRAEEKIEIVRVDGKTQVRPLGWMPICEKRFMFEMTCSMTLSPETPGCPRDDLPHKIQEQHRGVFTPRQPITEKHGEALAAWAKGGASKPAASVPVATPSGPPRLIEVPTDAAGAHQWAEWGKAFADAIKGAATLADVDGWMVANAMPLLHMAEASPKMRERINAIAAERIAALQEKELT